MPGYIGYTPQFNPISLQEYLTVPTMILNEYSKAEDIYNETATKAEALKALLGERNADNEAGWRIVDNYEKQLSDLTNTIANGVQGPDAYRQAKNASKYYRENMLPLESGIPAYQKELERYNSDPSMIGSRPVLENYIKNPLYKGYMLSGDKIYKDMVDQGKMAAADRNSNDVGQSGISGYISQITSIGYSPEEQREYLDWIQDALLNNDESAIQKLQSSDKYSQLYEGLNAYMKDHAFDQLDNNSKLNALNRAISGQLYGMTGNTQEKLITDKVWESNNAFNNWKRQKQYEWDNNPENQQPQIDLRQNRGTYINQYDENQDNALEKMSKTIDYDGKKINPIQAKRIVNSLDTIIQNSEKYQKLLTKRGAFLVNHPEYRGKSSDEFNRQAPFNKEYFEIIDAISDFENNNIKYVRTRDELSKLKNKLSNIKDRFSDILYSDKKIKEYGEQLGFDPNSSDEEIYSNLKTNNRIYVGTNINASNAAGRTLKDDISGSLTQTISANPSHLKRAVKAIGSNDYEKLEDILVSSEDSSTKQKTYGGNDYHITLESIIDESLATTGKQLKKSKNKNNIYLIPAQIFGSQAVSAIRNSLTQLNTDENGKEYIVGFNPAIKSHREALIDLYERNGLEEVVKNTVASSIHAAYGYNFFQSQPNTSTK